MWKSITSVQESNYDVWGCAAFFSYRLPIKISGSLIWRSRTYYKRLKLMFIWYYEFVKILGTIFLLLMLIGVFIVIPSHENRDGLSYSPSWDLITLFPDSRSIDYKRQAIQTITLGFITFLCFSANKKKS
jgi:hypothetical protein